MWNLVLKARALWNLAGKFLLHLSAYSRKYDVPPEILRRHAADLEKLAREIRREVNEKIP